MFLLLPNVRIYGFVGQAQKLGAQSDFAGRLWQRSDAEISESLRDQS